MRGVLFFLIVLTASCSKNWRLMHEGPENDSANKSVIGIGASIDYDSLSGYPYVVDILSNSPAANAGLRNGDRITSINGKDAHRYNSKRVLNLFHGKQGSQLTLTVRRGSKEISFPITREEINIPIDNGNFCDSLKKLLSSSLNDFDDSRGLPSEMPGAWLSKTLLPGFQSASIETSHTDGVRAFYSVYYECSDSIQMSYKLTKLDRAVEDCNGFIGAGIITKQKTANGVQYMWRLNNYMIMVWVYFEGQYRVMMSIKRQE